MNARSMIESPRNDRARWMSAGRRSSIVRFSDERHIRETIKQSRRNTTPLPMEVADPTGPTSCSINNKEVPA